MSAAASSAQAAAKSSPASSPVPRTASSAAGSSRSARPRAVATRRRPLRRTSRSRRSRACSSCRHDTSSSRLGGPKSSRSHHCGQRSAASRTSARFSQPACVSAIPSVASSSSQRVGSSAAAATCASTGGGSAATSAATGARSARRASAPWAWPRSSQRSVRSACTASSSVTSEPSCAGSRSAAAQTCAWRRRKPLVPGARRPSSIASSSAVATRSRAHASSIPMTWPQASSSVSGGSLPPPSSRSRNRCQAAGSSRSQAHSSSSVSRRAADVGVRGRATAELVEQASQRRDRLALVRQRRQELARHDVPDEELHVVAAQQQRSFAVPADTTPVLPARPALPRGRAPR